jgi:FKBP-type peptidyl-prolyl cis-trans isomerase (trigger factor)
MKSYYYMFMGTQCLSNEALAGFVYQYGSYFGLTISDKKVSTMTKAFASNAAAAVKQNMLFYYVAEAEGLEVTDDEYDAYVAKNAKESKVSEKDFVKNNGGEDAIIETMLFTEVSELLRDLVKTQLSLK